MNITTIRAAIESKNPEIVEDLLDYAEDLRRTGNIKAAADIKLQLLKLVATDDGDDGNDELLVFKQVRRPRGDS